MREAELYAPVKAFLAGQGYDVKAEVEGCDVVAVRDGAVVVVELKVRFNLDLLLQGVNRLKLTDAVYIAVPRLGRRWRDIKALCRRIGLGILLVEHGEARAILDPVPYVPRGNPRRRRRLLKEFAHRVGDPNTGGANRVKVMTAYRQDALRCLAALDRAGELSLAMLRAQTGVGRAAGILQRDVYGWFERVRRGVYAPSPRGREALRTYADAISTLPSRAEVA
ncbi:MAG: DUF2161 family putative PD-(D/E)XK-type phosphodiesterase [Alphaproteobacteria bacterium]